MAKKATKKRKRLVRGKDWHAWAWEQANGELLCYAQCTKPRMGYFNMKPTTQPGKWVRVKFVKV